MNPLDFSQPHKPFEFIEHEVDVDGSVHVWRRSPFPEQPYPDTSQRTARHVETVRIADLIGTQSGVTEAGLRLYERRRPHARPYVYRAQDGRMFILDGHHRLAAALLRGQKTAEVDMVDEA